VVFVIAIYLSVSISTSVAFASEARLTKIEAASVEYFANVNRSVELREQAVSPYIARTAEQDGKKFTVYSDDFAGVFIDEQGFLNIAVVGEPQQKSRYGGQVI
jgi:hypothetical protein